MKIKDSIIIAISKGRILEEGMQLLGKLGVKINEDISESRKLIYQTNNSNLKLVISESLGCPDICR